MGKLKKYSNIFLVSFMLIVVFLLNSTMVKAVEKPTAGHYHPKDILDWSLEKYPDQKNNISTVPLAERVKLQGEGTHAKNSDGKVMAIMIANATTSGAPAQGGTDYRYGYAFSHWQYVDTLVYWGGSAGEGIIVTPSADFVDSAHKNGVKVIGTVFFPPEAYGGQSKWIEEFVKKDEKGNYILVDKLIEIADTLGFDGWFINQETNTSYGLAWELKEFLREYNKKTDKTLVWYDSMLSNGSVNWQGALNFYNKDYIRDNGDEISDEIFVDFRWRNGSTNNVETSISTANSIGFNPKNVFFGFDVQGKSNLGRHLNTPGRGFSPLLDESKNPKLSLGLYVPDSVMRESSSKQGQDFWNSVFKLESDLWVNSTGKLGNASEKPVYWEGISNHFSEKTPIITLPFSSSFNLGAGDNFYRNGKIEKEGAFLNRSTQDVMPTYRWKYENYDGNNLVPNLDMTDAYYGGSSVKLEGTFAEGGSTENVLFGSQITIDKNMKATVIKKGDAKVSLLLINEQNEKFVVQGAEEKGDWDKLTYDLSELSDQRIKQFGVKIDTTNTQINKVNIGNITIGEIKDGLEITNFDVLDSKVDSGVNAKINFTIETNKKSTLVNIYEEINGQRRLLGSTKNGLFYVEDVKRPSDDNSVIRYLAIASDSNNKLLESTVKYLDFDFGKLAVPEADFIFDKSFVKIGEDVTFTQKSSISASEFEWNIPGASIEKTTGKTVTVSFEKPGVYSATLIAKNVSGEDREYKKNIITVYDEGYVIENLALKPGVTDDVSGECNIYTEASQFARDNRANTKWCDNKNDNPYLMYALEKKSTIIGFELLHASEGGEGAEFNTRNFDILVSDNNKDWKTVVEVRDNKAGFTKHAVNENARYVKLNILRGEQGGRVARIYEFRVMGFEGELKEVVPNQDQISELRDAYFNTLIKEEQKEEFLPALLEEYENLRERAEEILNSNRFNPETDQNLAKELISAYEKLEVSKVTWNVVFRIVNEEGAELEKLEEQSFTDFARNVSHEIQQLALKHMISSEYTFVSLVRDKETNTFYYNFTKTEKPSTITSKVLIKLVGERGEDLEVLREESFTGAESEINSKINELVLEYLTNLELRFVESTKDDLEKIITYKFKKVEITDKVKWTAIIRLVDEHGNQVEKVSEQAFEGVAGEVSLKLHNFTLEYIQNPEYKFIKSSRDEQTETFYFDFVKALDKDDIWTLVVRLVEEDGAEKEVLLREVYSGKEEELLPRMQERVLEFTKDKNYILLNVSKDEDTKTYYHNFVVEGEKNEKFIVSIRKVDEKGNVLDTIEEETFEGIYSELTEEIQKFVETYLDNNKYKLIKSSREENNFYYDFAINKDSDISEENKNSDKEPRYSLVIKPVKKGLLQVHQDLNEFSKGYNYKVFDVTVRDENNEIVTETKVPLEIKINEDELNISNKNRESLRIFNNHNGELIEIKDSKFVDGKVIFESSQFSDYVFVTKADDAVKVDNTSTDKNNLSKGEKDKNADNSSIVDKVPNKDSNNSSKEDNNTNKGAKVVQADGKAKTTTVVKTKSNPKTGDSGVIISTLFVMISFGALISLKSKKNYN